MGTAATEIAHQFERALEDLTFNSKPIIMTLTEIARENLPSSRAIARVIVDRIKKVPASLKLPSLYLLDSIAKTVGGDYVPAFAQSIVSVFCDTYEKSDERTRMALRHLLGTWEVNPLDPRAPPVFPPEKLRAIREQLNLPISLPPPPPAAAAPAGPSLHAYASIGGAAAPGLAAPAAVTAHVLQAQIDALRQQLYGQLAAVAAAQVQPVPVAPAAATPAATAAAAAQALLQQLAARPEALAALLAGTQPPAAPVPAPAPAPAAQPLAALLAAAIAQQQRAAAAAATAPILPTPSPPPPPPPQPAAAPAPASALPLPPAQPASDARRGALLPLPPGGRRSVSPPRRLAPGDGSSGSGRRSVSAGRTPPRTGSPAASRPQSWRDMLSSEALRRRDDSYVRRLYVELPVQCAQCGLRFAQQEALGKHLDWHFQLNRRATERAQRPTSRAWYLTAADWSTAPADMDDGGAQEAAPAFPDEAGAAAEEERAPPPVAPADERQEECPVCRERFETFWDEAAETWMVRGVVRERGMLYHTSCAPSTASAAAAAAAADPSATVPAVPVPGLGVPDGEQEEPRTPEEQVLPEAETKRGVDQDAATSASKRIKAEPE